MPIDTRKYLALVALFTILVVWVATAVPTAEIVVHGWYYRNWPFGTVSPNSWFGSVAAAEFGPIATAYIEWATGQFPLPVSSFDFALAYLVVAVAAALALWPSGQNRDDAGIFGQARWASWLQLRKLRVGLELGRTLKSVTPVRVKFIGNLMTFAPPRAGKGVGLIIPNLLVCDNEAWAGPVVCVDPKGEAATAATDRRRALGRHVVNLDPLSILQNVQRARATWNPLAGCGLDDILKLQRMAAALVPTLKGDGSDSAGYFRSKVTEMLVAAMLIEIANGSPSLVGVRTVVDGDPDAFAAAIDTVIERHPNLKTAVLGAQGTLRSEPRVRDPVKASATPALAWLSDPRMSQFVSGSSFDLEGILQGDMDIFLSIPPEEIPTLAPLLRLFLSQLFSVIRRGRPAERVLLVIDEAASLGRFDEIPIGMAELPGHGLSTWLIWQTRGQLVSTYGREGAHTLFQAAEFITLSNVAAGDGHEAEEWSRAIGSFTAVVESDGRSSSSHGAAIVGTHGTSKNQSRTAARLITPDRLTNLPRDRLIVLPNGDLAGTRPMLLRKTRYFDDRRFNGLYRDAKRVGRS